MIFTPGFSVPRRPARGARAQFGQTNHLPDSIQAVGSAIMASDGRAPDRPFP